MENESLFTIECLLTEIKAESEFHHLCAGDSAARLGDIDSVQFSDDGRGWKISLVL